MTTSQQGPSASASSSWAPSPRQKRIVAVLAVAAVVLTIAVTMRSRSEAAAQIEVRLTGCAMAGSAEFPLGEARFEVVNRSSRTQSVTVAIEYRDGSGARVDTDRSLVRDVAPGDTVKAREQTALGTTIDDLSCSVTAAR